MKDYQLQDLPLRRLKAKPALTHQLNLKNKKKKKKKGRQDITKPSNPINTLAYEEIK